MLYITKMFRSLQCGRADEHWCGVKSRKFRGRGSPAIWRRSLSLSLSLYLYLYLYLSSEVNCEVRKCLQEEEWVLWSSGNGRSTCYRYNINVWLCEITFLFSWIFPELSHCALCLHCAWTPWKWHLAMAGHPATVIKSTVGSVRSLLTSLNPSSWFESLHSTVHQVLGSVYRILLGGEGGGSVMVLRPSGDGRS